MLHASARVSDRCVGRQQAGGQQVGGRAERERQREGQERRRERGKGYAGPATQLLWEGWE